MKYLWIAVAAVGALALVIAANMSTVPVGSDTNNIGLVADKLTAMIAAAAVFVVGGVGVAVSFAMEPKVITASAASRGKQQPDHGYLG
jgi:hypothetical protein